ncbi:hypothetical protein J6590_054565 [Homalodisca vitripennis]|nr:hypothetical protein J6590_054565 [Homalodisca vitripennis]
MPNLDSIAGLRVSDAWAGQWKDFLFHKVCVEQLRGDQRACNPRMSGGLPLIDMTTLMGPPEVRVVRLSLTTRPQEPRAPPPELPRAPRPPRQHVSPLRVRPRRTKKKKKSQQIQTDADMDSKSQYSTLPGSTWLYPAGHPAHPAGPLTPGRSNPAFHANCSSPCINCALIRFPALKINSGVAKMFNMQSVQAL